MIRRGCVNEGDQHNAQTRLANNAAAGLRCDIAKRPEVAHYEASISSEVLGTSVVLGAVNEWEDGLVVWWKRRAGRGVTQEQLQADVADDFDDLAFVDARRA